LSLIAETEAKIAEELTRSDSDSDSDSSLNSSMFSSDLDDDIPAASKAYLHHIAALYSCHYWEERGKINEDNSQLQLLLHDWKYNCPEIFCTYCGESPQNALMIYLEQSRMTRPFRTIPRMSKLLLKSNLQLLFFTSGIMGMLPVQ
jgi:hypothetical protein